MHLLLAGTGNADAAGALLSPQVANAIGTVALGIILFSGGRVGFVEVKAPGKQPRALQLSRHEELKALGFLVFVLDNDERIGEIIDEICAS